MFLNDFLALVETLDIPTADQWSALVHHLIRMVFQWKTDIDLKDKIHLSRMKIKT